MRKLLLFCLFLLTISLHSQDYFPTDSGVKTTENTLVAFTNATIYVTPEKVLKKGTLLIKDGKVKQVGKNIKIPKGTKTVDLSGKTVYPSFIDLYSDFGIKKPKSATRSYRNAQYDASREGYYWNDHIRPDINPIRDFSFDTEESAEKN